MGSCGSTANQAIKSNMSITYLQKKVNDKKNYLFSHSKHYERYFNHQFKVSVCSAKGERMKMEDDHSCIFSLPNHPNYSLFGIFDGHNGPEAAQYLAKNLYKTLNNIKDLENNQNIISEINKMDKIFMNTQHGTSGSTIVFAIISSDIASMRDLLKNNTGYKMEYNGRIFWCGDSRAYSIKSLDNSMDFPSFDYLTNDHDSKNKFEMERMKEMDGTCTSKVIKGRVDGKLAVTRAFGDNTMKYEGSLVTSECQYSNFQANVGDCLLLCCDGLTEKWSHHRLIEKLRYNFCGRNRKSNDMDTAKAIGDLVDDAIYEGSKDNISAMFIQFNDGTLKQKVNKKYENVFSNVLNGINSKYLL